LEAIDHTLQRGVEVGPAREVLIGHDRSRDAVRRGEYQTFGIGAITDDGRDPGRPMFGFGGAGDGLHIAASPGNQHNDVSHGAHCTVRLRSVGGDGALRTPKNKKPTTRSALPGSRPDLSY